MPRASLATASRGGVVRGRYHVTLLEAQRCRPMAQGCRRTAAAQLNFEYETFESRGVCVLCSARGQRWCDCVLRPARGRYRRDPRDQRASILSSLHARESATSVAGRASISAAIRVIIGHAGGNT